MMPSGSPPHLQPFLLQLAEWTGAVILSRIVCGSVVCSLPFAGSKSMSGLPQLFI